MSDQMTYMLAGDVRPRRGPKSLANSSAFKIQGGRVLPDPEPLKLAPLEESEEVNEQPAALRGRPRKNKADADQA